ncbi:MAG: polysaccharide biosynthesis C-terminal domain-containing protein [Bacilli bacterium]|nr:polysaccharide biosynthesis C-terminal domain-containing protein [Bacilli bacterium]
MRTKKIFLNMICDILPYLLIGVVGIIKMDVLITYIGDAGNGYYQTINQIISYVFLAQAGFSDAVIYSLYKPFANKNKDDINAIYGGARKIFKRIGYIIFGIICLVTLGLYLFYNFEDGFRSSSLICFFIISTSYLISYFGRGQTYMAVLSAAQEKYVYSLIFNGIKLLCDILIVVATMKFRNLESIAIVILIMKILEEIVNRIVVKKKYPDLHEIARKDTSMVKMTKDLAWTQVGYLVLNNTDALLLMGFSGPVMVSVYTSYNFILRFLNEVASRVELSSVYSFGNVFAKKEEERVYPLFREFLILFILIAFSMSITFMIGIRGFVNVWVGKENYLISYLTIILFTSTLFLNILYYPLVALINADGLFKDNKKHIFICAITNLILSIVLINFFDLDGLLIGTMISFLVNILLKTSLISRKILRDVKLFSILKYYLITISLYILLSIVLMPIESYFLSISTGFVKTILMLGVIFVLVSGITACILYFISKDARNLFKRGINLIKRKLKK